MFVHSIMTFINNSTRNTGISDWIISSVSSKPIKKKKYIEQRCEGHFEDNSPVHSMFGLSYLDLE